MLGRFGRDAGSLLGVEITPPFIRLVHAHRRQGRCQVGAWAIEPLPAAALHNGWIVDPELVGTALLRAVSRSAMPGRRVAVALPGALVVEKQLAMPIGLDDDALVEQLPEEASAFIPFALEDAALDFQQMGPDPDNPQCQRVVVAACHLALLEVLHASLECAGLRACVVEADHHALRRALPVSSVREALWLQVEDQSVVFHEVGGEAAGLRRQIPLGSQPVDAQALAAAVDTYLLSSPGRALPDQLQLLGGGVLAAKLPGQLQQRLGIEVLHADPFGATVLAPGLKSDALAAQAPCLAVACGLAMRVADPCLD
ncbi:hypothetical protein CQ065_12685 [Pseudomonas sp. MYb187]|uniref:type IV pilus biogenesis protein PilM n=1 Tax=Pseudomonas TaxID=286 RepID=UPI000CFDF0FF|nr:pilus assembly protein PilM [Pseudomonas sp. MYb187]PRA64828.1 hypothetical protein CQ065_12685 [Pseudomonas sp. MYb187]